MFNKKIALTGLMAILLSSSMSVPQSKAASALDHVQFQMNKKSYTNSTGNHPLIVAPFTVNGHSMVPLRALAQSLGTAISWNPNTHTVTLSGQPFGQITLKANTKFSVDAKGEQTKLPESIKLVNGSLIVPAKSLAELMGAQVKWNPSTQTITITKNTTVRDNLSISYTFNTSNEGWKGDFADLPVDYNKEIYALKYARALLPIGGNNTTNYGLKLVGANRSDDLFMFLTQKVENLTPNTTYQVKLDIGMYTKESGGMSGIGGSPSESVYVKAAVLNKEPKAVQKDDGSGLYYRMNIDKGDQSNEGVDAKILGNITKPNSDREGFQRVNFSYNTTVKTNSKGELFVMIGTDSGYEGLTTLYYDDIKLSAVKK
ncbi:copper amine oxidase N-terminal domain-containing protein [Paenibacillus wynnii]|uniref:copper amine oxidase N-terminal domain-containing protein n=1 Tax=Paenibacillus wynnii TaxID=268407 RepID=UPI0006892403|nr:copper amine oxidase N-terminal domain-containing protein [Paenibacillus wynnii]